MASGLPCAEASVAGVPPATGSLITRPVLVPPSPVQCPSLVQYTFLESTATAHGACPASPMSSATRQPPLVHPVGHSSPHPPQFFGSVSSFTHPLPQTVSPFGQPLSPPASLGLASPGPPSVAES